MTCQFLRIKIRTRVVFHLFIIFTLIFALLPLDNIFAHSINPAPSVKKILVLHTFKSKRPWILLFNRYLVNALHKSNLTNYELEIENLDLVEFNQDEYKAILRKQLEFKYNNHRPDIIITTLNPAANFIIENNLFPHTPST